MLTTDQVNVRLSPRNIELVGTYLGSQVKNKFRCNKFHVWEAAPSKVFQGHGCAECFGTKRLTSDIVNARLASKKISLIGEYESALTKSQFQCNLGHIWTAKPADVMGKSGCPSCADYGFNLSKKAFGYVIVYENFLKYGITNKLNQRLEKHINSNGQFIKQYSRSFETGYLAKQWEDSIKTTLGGRYVSKDICPDGYTETLSDKYLKEVIEKLQSIEEI